MAMRIIKLLCLLLVISPLWAQEVLVERYPAGSDIWILLPYNMFNFGKGEDSAFYQISMQIKDAKGKQKDAFEKRVELPHEGALKHTALAFLQKSDLEPGTYQLQLSIKNQNLGYQKSFNHKIKIPERYTPLGEAFVLAKKGELMYLPAAWDFAWADSLKLRFSFGEQPESLILHGEDKMLLPKNPQSPWEVDLKSLGADSLAMLSISYIEGNIRYSKKPFFYREWLSFKNRYTLKDQREQLRYIADQNEWRKLRKASESRLGEAIEEFWLDNDPSPGTAPNELREKFYSRVLKADELFTLHKRMKGWRSDRGRIYIKFGEPEEIVNNPFPVDEPPSIGWNYFKQKKFFLFRDYGGFGRYELVNKEMEYDE